VSQLRDLARRFPSSVIHTNPSGGGVYVPHHLYVQRLLMHLGGYRFERVDIIRGHVAGKKPDPNGSSARAKAGTPDLEGAVVGVVCRLTVEVDGRTLVIEDVGDCESPHNWPHDGARLKDAMSDALKRCCARIGLGTHLYSKSDDDYVLYRVLTDQEEVSGAGGADVPTGGDGVPANDGAGIEGPASEFCDACKAGDCQHCVDEVGTDDDEPSDQCQCPHDDGRPFT
jgi:hypothetical protein